MIDAADIDQLTTATVMNPTFGYFDLDGSGMAHGDDRTYWVEHVRKTYFGDANLDGEFGSRDLVTVFTAGEYEDELVGNSTWASGDWNWDGDFTTSDLVKAFDAGGTEQGPRVAVAVPEPTTCNWLLAFALGLWSRARRHRAAAPFRVIRLFRGYY
ncbi:MAG: hypothetical protein KDA92_18565 [Planctomycetales bacterium]|nr:hypothetical protein [Planctomycetales bacterium]MCA9169971.1 hypothetical protein [Planctomycetales bacterium]